jgi:peptide-methionine (S)-S-oxide reductase
MTMRPSFALGLPLLLLPVLAALPFITAHSQTVAVRIDPPAAEAPTEPNMGLETAVLAGGCFWGVQAVYQHTKGVVNAVSGYAGGSPDDANYQSVSFGRTGHAEAVSVTFDPRVVSYGKILQIFFSVAHDPTQLNRQGPDYGTQYRSEIFPQTDAQRRVARAYIAQLDAARAFAKPIVTKTDADKAKFYPAEEYHQDFAVKNPTYPYIVVHDKPKVEQLKALFPDVYRATPMTVAAAKAAGH